MLVNMHVLYLFSHCVCIADYWVHCNFTCTFDTCSIKDQSINQSITWTTARGRPRKRWLDNIAEDCEDLNLFKRRVLQTTEWNGEILSATRAAGGSERGDIVFVAESLSQKSESSSAVAQLPFVALLLYCDGGQGIVGLIQWRRHNQAWRYKDPQDRQGPWGGGWGVGEGFCLPLVEKFGVT